MDPNEDLLVVTEERLVHWEEAARDELPELRIGDINWPRMVLSLAAEIRRLKSEGNAA